jgi:ketosteroid isomerase-like protein
MMLDLTPVRIAVVGDAAVAHYYFSFYGERMGEQEAISGKNTEFYVKENGKWLLLGDHTSTKVEEEDDD